jgi:hypothetical protein
MYENRTKPLLPRKDFLHRLLNHGALAFVIIFGSLVIGVLGYHGIAHLAWVDAVLNASMIMGGMGPVDALTSTGSKLFASAYALYSGLVLLISVGILMAPVVHRVLHRFHLASDLKS